MARIQESSTLTPGNRIYLYRLLSQELGCGKQTFLPAVEEALASDRMTADDLGFDSTRALLEALDEFIKLTVFKGGRIYATVVSQPAWDDALAALASGKQSQADSASKANKPWKRKKADKSLKPVRPKRVKRIEPEPVAASEPMAEPEPPVEPAAKTQPESETVIKAELEPAVEPRSEPIVEAAPATETANEGASAGIDVPEVVTEPSPAIALTVTYDPYSGIDRETKLVSHPVTAPAPERRNQRESAPAVAPVTPSPATGPSQATAATAPKPMKPSAMPMAAPAQAEEATAPAQASPTQASSAQPKAAIGDTQPATARPEPARSEPLAPEILASYPEDFSTDVYLASDRIAELCELLPYGTDVFALLAEDYARARTLQLIAGTRARATFPLRIQHADSIEPIRISLKKRSGTGLQWELSAVE